VVARLNASIRKGLRRSIAGSTRRESAFPGWSGTGPALSASILPPRSRILSLTANRQLTARIDLELDLAVDAVVGVGVLAADLPGLAGDDVGVAEDEFAAYGRLPNTRSRQRRTLITSQRSPYVSESVSASRANASCFAQA
jgi:hypothetical protein